MPASWDGLPGVRLLDFSSDTSHNRSVLTAVGDAPSLKAATLALFARAIEAIDLRQHQGEHPRLGAVDVVPFVTLWIRRLSKLTEGRSQTRAPHTAPISAAH